MSLADEFAQDAADLIEDFGEPIEWRVAGEAPRTFLAVIMRRPPESAPMGPRVGRPSIHIDIRTSDVPFDSIDWTRTSVGASYAYGGAIENFRLGSPSALVRHSPGRFTVSVR